MTDLALTEASVAQFLYRFERIGERENFDLLEGMVHPDAVFRFNDGDFVGCQAVRGAFETTWRSGGVNVTKERTSAGTSGPKRVSLQAASLSPGGGGGFGPLR